MRHDPERGVFEQDTPTGPAWVSYAMRPDDVFEITYTFVPPAGRSGGLGARMVLEARDWARDHGHTVTASCGFAARVLAEAP